MTMVVHSVDSVGKRGAFSAGSLCKKLRAGQFQLEVGCWACQAQGPEITVFVL